MQQKSFLNERSFWDSLAVAVLKVTTQQQQLNDRTEGADIVISTIRQYVRQKLLTSASDSTEGNRGTPVFDSAGASLFSIAWEAYTLCCMVDTDTAVLMIGETSPSSISHWYQQLSCILLLESCCTCTNQCLPNDYSNTRTDDTTSGATELLKCFTNIKMESPFFHMLVQAALTVLRHTSTSMKTEGPTTATGIDGEENIAQITILQYIESSLLEDILGITLFTAVMETIHLHGDIPDHLRSEFDQKIQYYSLSDTTTKTDSATLSGSDSSVYVNPIILFSSTNDLPTAEMIKSLSNDTTIKRLHPKDLLDPTMTAMASVPVPFARPLPPPLSLPFVGYDDDDYDDDDCYIDENEEADVLDYLHAELIWCTPICNRLMLLPTDLEITNEPADEFDSELYQDILTILQSQAFSRPILPNERRMVIDYFTTVTGNYGTTTTATKKAIERLLRLIQECGLTPQTLPKLVEHNPLVAHECLLLLLQQQQQQEQQHMVHDSTDSSRKKDEYLSSLVNMDMSLHSMEVMNRLAMHHITASTNDNNNDDDDDNSSTNNNNNNNYDPNTARRQPLLHPEYIHLFIGSCIASCENMSLQQPLSVASNSSNVNSSNSNQSRLVRLVCVFISSLLRNHIITSADIYFEVQSFCVEFSRIREASTLYKSLQESTTTTPSI